MTAETISINRDIAQDTGRQLLSEQESLQEAYDQLRAAKDSLMCAWEGSASSAFSQAVLKLVGEGDSITSELAVFGGQITQADLTLAEMDQLIACRMGRLG